MTETSIPEIDAARYATRRARRAAERAQELAALAANEISPAPISAEIPTIAPASPEGPVRAGAVSAFVADPRLLGIDPQPAAPIELGELPAQPAVLRRPRPVAHSAPSPSPAARPPSAASLSTASVSTTSVSTASLSVRTHPRSRMARALFSGVAMLCAGGLGLALLLPGTGTRVASAMASEPVAPEASSSAAVAGQSLVLADPLAAAASSIADRDEFAAMSRADVIRAEYAGQVYHPTFVPTAGAIRWPFSYPVAVSAPYGYSSRYVFGWHDGVDFIPGSGAPASAIADGVVTWVGVDGALGYCVRIEHQIDGHRVVSVYAHMIEGSSKLYPSEQIEVGTVVGRTGQTGLATGPHLHLGLMVDGKYTDPFLWLTINATNAD